MTVLQSLTVILWFLIGVTLFSTQTSLLLLQWTPQCLRSNSRFIQVYLVPFHSCLRSYEHLQDSAPLWYTRRSGRQTWMTHEMLVWPNGKREWQRWWKSGWGIRIWIWGSVRGLGVGQRGRQVPWASWLPEDTLEMTAREAVDWSHSQSKGYWHSDSHSYIRLTPIQETPSPAESPPLAIAISHGWAIWA